MENLNIAAYIRVSTKKQAEKGSSLQTQKESIDDYISKEFSSKYNVSIDYFIEERSATKALVKEDNKHSSDDKYDISKLLGSRPKLKELISDISQHKYQHLVVFKRDRLARNTGQYLALKQYLKTYGVKLHFSSTGENLDLKDDKYNRLLEVILASFAELESQTIGTRVRMGCLTAISNGYRPGARIPYGYKNLLIEKKQRLAPSSLEMNTVERIYDLYLRHGYGFRKISEILNKEQDTFHWSKGKVESILKNEIYTGKTMWGKRKGNKSLESRELILDDSTLFIPDKTWQETNALRELKSNNRDPNYFSSPYLLKGKLYYNYQDNKDPVKMQSRNYGNNSLVYRTPKKNADGHYYIYDKDTLDRVVLEQLKLLLTPSFLYKSKLLFEEICRNLEVKNKMRLEEITAEIDKLVEYVIDLQKLLEQGYNGKIQDRIEQQLIISNNILEAHKNEKKQIEYELKRLHDVGDNLHCHMHTLLENITDPSNISLRMFIHIAIDKIYISENNGMLNIKIIFNLPQVQ